MVTAYAPMSLEILGNHTDYNEGLALAAALQFGVTMEGEVNQGQDVVLHHEGLGETEKFFLPLAQKHHQHPWANAVKAVIQELLKSQIALSGFEATIRNNLPPLFHINSGSMLAVAAAVFLQRAFPFEANAGRLATLCRDAENQIGNPYGGLLGPMASFAAAADSILQIDFRTLEARSLAFPATHKFVVCDTGIKNLLVHTKIKLRHDQCREALRVAKANASEIQSLRDVNPVEMQKFAGQMNEYVFRTAMHVCTENQRVRESVEALARGDITAFAANMNLSQLSSKQSIENSAERIDQLIETARDLPGFTASRLSGHGFGGLTIHLVASEHAETFMNALGGPDTSKAFIVELSAGALVA